MTPGEFATRMRNILDNSDLDAELEHAEADKLVLELLESIGYNSGATFYRGAMEARWYHY